MSNNITYEHYRTSTIGKALTDSIDDLVVGHIITPQLALKVLQNFDVAIMETLAARKPEPRITFKAHLETYRFCDDVWTFILRGVTFKFPGTYLEPLETNRLSVIAMGSKKATELEQQK